MQGIATNKIREDVMAHFVPEDWQHVNYDKQCYYLFELKEDQSTYKRELIPFLTGEPRLKVISLKRVQNLYQRLRFVARKENREFRNENVRVVKYYHPIHSSDEEIALECNMDVRHYGYAYNNQNSVNHNPKFFITPDLAYKAIGHIPTNKKIIICDVLQSNGESPATTYKTNDTEYMPVFVATLQPNE